MRRKYKIQKVKKKHKIHYEVDSQIDLHISHNLVILLVISNVAAPDDLSTLLHKWNITKDWVLRNQSIEVQQNKQKIL